MPPHPTVSRGLNHIQPAQLDPHAESHEVNGDDPVLGGVRLLGLAISTVSQTITTTFAESESDWEEITALTQTVHSRGGTLRITFGGTRSISDESEFVMGEFRVYVGDTLLPTYITAYPDTGASAFGTNILEASSLIWFTDVVPGVYTVKIEAVSYTINTGTIFVPAYDGDTAFLQVEEILPIRRG